MKWMFFRAESFYQNLSKWCVPIIAEEPENFSTESPLQDKKGYHPNWGCKI